jgi:hypothetical protein
MEAKVNINWKAPEDTRSGVGFRFLADAPSPNDLINNCEFELFRKYSDCKTQIYKPQLTRKS